jgi:hypothetical protein
MTLRPCQVKHVPLADPFSRIFESETCSIPAAPKPSARCGSSARRAAERRDAPAKIKAVEHARPLLRQGGRQGLRVRSALPRIADVRTPIRFVGVGPEADMVSNSSVRYH